MADVTDAGRATLATMAEIGVALSGGRWSVRDEAALQREVERVLRERFGDRVRREVDLFHVDRILRPRSIGRVDFTVDDVGLELKVHGSRAAVLKQAQRYLGSPMLAALVVASTHVALLSRWPATLAGKPVSCVSLRTWA